MASSKMSLRWHIAQLAERQWWRNYLSNKPKADYLAWKQQYWQDLLAKITPILPTPTPDTRYLDAGCGPAGIFIALQQGKITAIDPLLDQYAQYLPHFVPTAYPLVNFRNIPLENFSEQEEYDVVFCMNAINHVSNMLLCLDKLVAALCSQGSLVISIDAHRYTFFKQLFRLLPGDILHPHQYDLDEYIRLITQNNCKLQSKICLKREFFFEHYLLVFQKEKTKAPESPFSE